jgi:hypothetical protein
MANPHDPTTGFENNDQPVVELVMLGTFNHISRLIASIPYVFP